MPVFCSSSRPPPMPRVLETSASASAEPSSLACWPRPERYSSICRTAIRRAAFTLYRRYPVLYLRDGAKFFHSFTGAIQQLTSDATPHAPEMIVVAIVVVYFEMMANAYPGSWAAWNGLGDAHYAKGDRITAAKMYEKSLTLNSDNENARKMLKVLRGQ